MRAGNYNPAPFTTGKNVPAWVCRGKATGSGSVDRRRVVRVFARQLLAQLVGAVHVTRLFERQDRFPCRQGRDDRIHEKLAGHDVFGRRAAKLLLRRACLALLVQFQRPGKINIPLLNEQVRMQAPGLDEAKGLVGDLERLVVIRQAKMRPREIEKSAPPVEARASSADAAEETITRLGPLMLSGPSMKVPEWQAS